MPRGLPPSPSAHWRSASGPIMQFFPQSTPCCCAPLPYADPDRVVVVWEDASAAGFPHNTPAPGNYIEWKKRNHVFTDMAANRGFSANLTADGPPEQVIGRRATANFFPVLGVNPLAGRT